MHVCEVGLQNICHLSLCYIFQIYRTTIELLHIFKNLQYFKFFLTEMFIKPDEYPLLKVELLTKALLCTAQRFPIALSPH